MKYLSLLLLMLFAVPAFCQQTPYVQDCNKDDDAPDINYLDCRGTIEGMMFIGTAVDTFEGDQALRYLNPQDSGDVRLRGMGGIEVAYRLFGNPQYTRPAPSSVNNNHSWDPHNLWIFTRVVHGARSTDALCTDAANASNPGCIQKLVPPPAPNDVANQLYFIVRNATTLEGSLGLRWEFLRLQQQTNYPANVYFKAQAGFVSIAGTKGSALDVHQLSLGATATRSNWQDSYLEMGWGRTDFFTNNRRRRFKFEAQAQYHISGPMYFFAVGKMDTDVGPGSDAYQTYIGFKLDMKNIRNWATDNSTQNH